ncbi:MAG TPA: anti-sigma factor, partial [Armatimonadota bacterium]|nr:anti-sigma factor [Armatimonadota bacterium]
MEGDLPPEAEAQVVAHLDSCPQCRCRLEDLRAVIAAVTGLPELPPPADLRARISEAIAARAPQTGRRSPATQARYVLSGLAAAAAAVLIIWAGTMQLERQRTEGRQPPPMLTQRAEQPSAARPSAAQQAPAPSAAEQPEAGVGESVGQLPTGEEVRPPAVAGDVTGSHPPPEAPAHAVTPPSRERSEGPAPRPAPHPADHAPTPAEPVADETTPAREETPGSATIATAVAPEERAFHPPAPVTTTADTTTRSGAGGAGGGRATGAAEGATAPGVAGMAGAAGAAGPIGPPAPLAMDITRMAAAGNVADEVLRVEPKYFDADATMVARMGPVG